MKKKRQRRPIRKADPGTLFKRILSFVLAVAAVMSCVPLGARAAGPAGYEICVPEATLGQTFEVKVAITENPGIISLRMKVVYDETALELVKVTDQGLLKGFTTPAPTVASPYTLRWADSLAAMNNTAQGTVVTLTFRALAEGSTTVTVEHGEARSFSGDKVTFSGASATVTVTQEKTLFGDVDGNGLVNSKDRTLLARYLAGWQGYGQERVDMTAADVNADMAVDGKDRAILARYLTNWYGYGALPV